MKPVIGFSTYGDLGKYSAEAAIMKGFIVTGHIPDCDIVYISPDRPSNISPENAIDLVIPQMKTDAIIVVLCQVDVGFTRRIKWPNVYYQVETLRKGDELERALHPERIIIGYNRMVHIDHRLAQFLKAFNCFIFTMTYESAELAKMAINLYLAAQVSTTNTLCELAKKCGADWHDIIPALQTDKRIGQEAYLKPGFGLSQHLVRDLEAVIAMPGNMDVMKAFLDHSEYRRKLSDT